MDIIEEIKKELIRFKITNDDATVNAMDMEGDVTEDIKDLIFKACKERVTNENLLVYRGY